MFAVSVCGSASDIMASSGSRLDLDTGCEGCGGRAGVEGGGMAVY